MEISQEEIAELNYQTMWPQVIPRNAGTPLTKHPLLRHDAPTSTFPVLYLTNSSKPQAVLKDLLDRQTRTSYWSQFKAFLCLDAP
ncbi:hypothetical protein H0H92_007413 [Tricholoma furcatifolium]|nr:hypothetical protein H0H92_007413 [Tricholoma furcatifolium]